MNSHYSSDLRVNSSWRSPGTSDYFLVLLPDLVAGVVALFSLLCVQIGTRPLKLLRGHRTDSWGHRDNYILVVVSRLSMRCISISPDRNRTGSGWRLRSNCRRRGRRIRKTGVDILVVLTGWRDRRRWLRRRAGIVRGTTSCCWV